MNIYNLFLFSQKNTSSNLFIDNSVLFKLKRINLKLLIYFKEYSSPLKIKLSHKYQFKKIKYLKEIKMENINENKLNKTEKEQIIVLSNRTNLSVSGTNKVISIKSDLIQLDTVFGGLIITGEQLELIKLDNTTTRAEISGTINSFKFVESKEKEHFFRKIFK